MQAANIPLFPASCLTAAFMALTAALPLPLLAQNAIADSTLASAMGITFEPVPVPSATAPMEATPMETSAGPASGAVISSQQAPAMPSAAQPEPVASIPLPEAARARLLSPQEQEDAELWDRVSKARGPAEKMPSANSSDEAITPPSWIDRLSVLERENQALRARVNLAKTEPLADIKADPIAKIREDVLRQRITDLEKELERARTGRSGLADQLPDISPKGKIPMPMPPGKQFIDPSVLQPAPTAPAPSEAPAPSAPPSAPAPSSDAGSGASAPAADSGTASATSAPAPAASAPAPSAPAAEAPAAAPAAPAPSSH